MPEERDKPRQEKRTYEAPKLLELGTLARGQGGGPCSVGTSPTGGTCTPGNAALGLCTVGIGQV